MGFFFVATMRQSEDCSAACLFGDTGVCRMNVGPRPTYACRGPTV